MAAIVLGLGVYVATAPGARSDPLPGNPVVAVFPMASWVHTDSQLDSAGRDRLLTGMRLVQSGYAPRLITARIQPHTDGPTSDEGQARLVKPAGLDRQWTVLDGIQRSTRDEAIALRKVLPESSAIIVVTSPGHTRRACGTFERVGFRVTCVPSSERSKSVPRRVRERLYERLATMMYKYNGWIR